MRLLLLVSPLVLFACNPTDPKVDSNDPIGGADSDTPADDSQPTDDSQPAEEPNIVVDPSSLDLGLGAPNATLSAVLTVRNTGTGSLDGTAAANSGYSVDQGSFSIPAGGSISLTVSFSAADAGSYPGTLEILSNDPDSPSISVALTATIEADADGDGAPDSIDCAPNDPSIYPDAVEIWYNGIDENCDGNDDDQDLDGYPISSDCDDLNAAINPGAAEVWYNGIDENCDSIDDDQDLDGYGINSDCDDLDATVNPGATEVWYDGIDQNCDGNDDDQDLDGYGISSDCDDLDAAINPGATEIWYNGTDENCDGLDDDQDQDGYGIANDCNDQDATVNPGATEVWYNGIDEDCDGRDDDVDQDGYGIATDCNDLDATINPAATEVWYDGIDQNCDGNDDDQDGDGYGIATDCNDLYANINPGIIEVCDGIDQDCDGVADDNAIDADPWYTDGDGDQYGLDSSAVYACTQPAGTVAWGGDCDDVHAEINPGATEICDGLDNDCSGSIDDNAVDGTLYYQDADGDNWGGDTTLVSCTAPAGYQTTTGDCDDSDASIYPGATEIWYDGIDQNCDGNDNDQDGDGSPFPTDCNDQNAAINPNATEICDGLDNNCDGTTDSDAVDRSTWYTDADGDLYGDDASATLACTAPTGTIATGGDCDDSDAAIHPGATDIGGDGIDQDCDGVDAPLPASSSTWTVVGGSTNQGIGSTGALTNADMNGDGDTELILATIGDDTRATNAGAIAFHDYGTRGSNVSFSTGGYVLVGGANSGDGFGRVALPLGDIDGDGRQEMLGSSSTIDMNGRADSGAVYIFDLYSSTGTAYSGTTSVDSAREGRLYSENTYAYFGTSAAMGDFDGDGADDLMVGAPGYWYFGGYQNLGAVYVFDGANSWWNNNDNVTDFDFDGVIIGNATGVQTDGGGIDSISSWDDDFFGATMVAGDFNGDGSSDAVMCSPYASTNAGTCWMVDGGDMLGSFFDSVNSLDVASFTGAAANDELGGYNQSLAAADIDGDSIDDLILGARSYGSSNGGAVLVQYGGSWSGAYTPSTVDVLLTGDGGLGAAVSAPGDLDGDGIGELLLGAPDSGAGKVYLVDGSALGNQSLPGSAQLYSWVGETSGDLFGLNLGGVVDLDRDSTLDLVVAAPGYDYNSLSGSGKAYVLPTP